MTLTVIDKQVTYDVDFGVTVPFMSPAAGASVAIRKANGGVLAQLYSASTGGTLLNNPFTLGADARIFCYVESGKYDLEVTLAGETVTYADFQAVDDIVIEGPKGNLQFSDVASMKAGSAFNQQASKLNFANYLGQKVSTVVNNTISNKGGADYIITNVNPGNLSTLVDGIWVGANHDLGGGFYAEIVIQDGNVPVESFGAIADWNRVTRTGTNASPAIQSAINYAGTFVNTVLGVDPKGGAEVTVSGAHGSGMFRVVNMIRINKSNVSLKFTSGASLATDFGTAVDPANCAVVLVGTAEEWLDDPSISNTIKYNNITGLKVSRTGQGKPIGLMLSGVRNTSLSNIHIEQLYSGLWLENCSELTCSQFSSIGCTYGLIADNRKNRTTGESPLGISNADNDVSSSTLSGFNNYYSQHTGILLINTGTMSFYSSTVGRFSENPDTGSNIRYGLSGKASGTHVWGGRTGFTKSLLLEDFVYEPSPSTSLTCILLTSENSANPIRGITINNNHIQTYAADYTGGRVTTFLNRESYNGGGIDGVKVSNSGYTFLTSGFEYPILFDQTNTESVGFPVTDTPLVIDNCYPSVALSNSDLTSCIVRDIEWLSSPNIELDANPIVPSGWTLDASSVASIPPLANGIERYLNFSGNDGGVSYMYRNFRYRYYLSRMGSPVVSFYYRGTVAPHIDIIVNGASVTARTIKSGDNKGRYSNALQDPPHSTEWRRCFITFRPFSANTGFDNMDVQIGRGAGAVDDVVDIKNIQVGFYKLKEEPYNTF